jgi:hypothetical protein
MTLDEILARRTKTKFTSIVLSRFGRPDDVVYEGTALLEEHNSGELFISVSITRPLGIENIFQGLHGTQAGQIIEDSEHFSLRATCEDGMVWTADHVLTEGHQFQINTGLGTFVVRPQYLTTTLRSDAIRADTLHTVVIEGALSLRINKTELNSGVFVEFKTNKDQTEVRITHPRAVEPSIATRISNALSILSGGRNAWLCDIQEYEDKRGITLWGGYRRDQVRVMPTPLPNRFESNANFIALFVAQADLMEKVVDHWMSIYYAWQSSSSMAALPLSVGIEGLVNKYFPHLKAEGEDAVAAAAAAVAAVRLLSVSQELRDRLIGSVSNIGRGSIPRALRVLTEQGLLTRALASSYGVVRNRAAHAVDEEYRDQVQAQANVDKIFACLSLFYRLLLIQIQYRGSVVEHSLVGCPDGIFNPTEGATER